MRHSNASAIPTNAGYNLGRSPLEAATLINRACAWAHELAAGLGEPAPLEPIAR